MEHYKNLSLENIKETIDGVLNTEEWKPVSGYEELYKISNFGRIKRLKKFFKRTYPEKILIPQATSMGYFQIALSLKGERKYPYVHRLVAIHFINNSNEDKIEVNHKNGIKKDNFFKNLEWTTRSQNQLHAHKTGLQINKKGKNNPRSKTIIQYSLDGSFIKEWIGLRDIQRKLGYKYSCIIQSALGNYEHAYGFKWKYKD